MRKFLVVVLALGFGLPLLPGKAFGGDVADILDVLFYPPGVAEVHPGELPPGWPDTIPLPAEAALAGSLKLNDDSLVVAFTVPGEVGAVASPYLEALQAQGWDLIGKEIDEEEEHHSYTLQREGTDLLSFVLYAAEGATYGTLYYGEEDLAALRAVIELISGMMSSLAEVSVIPEFTFGDATVVEEAISPVPLFMDEETYQAKIESEGDAAALKDALEAQLLDAGWKSVDGGSSGSSVWGRYELEREGATWRAVLLVIPDEPGGRFFVSVHAYKIP